MDTFQGIPISGGIAIGPVFYKRTRSMEPIRFETDDPAVEIARYLRARDAAQSQYRLLAKDLEKKDKESAMIFRGFFWMLSDDHFEKQIISCIHDKKRSAEGAVLETQKEFLSLYNGAEDDLRLSRSADLSEIVSRLLAFLSESGSPPEPKTRYILAADELTPSDLLMSDQKKLLGILTRSGSAYSHIAVLARMLEIPFVIDISPDERFLEQSAVLDGYEGHLFLNPTEECKQRYQEIRQQKEEEKKALSVYASKKTIFFNGRRISVYANISSLGDYSSAIRNGAEGIGLFRSEFLFLGAHGLPEEELQFSIYKKALTTSPEFPVTVRTMDLGGDKAIPTLPGFPSQGSPSSLRGIRFALVHRDIFRIQLRALLRASGYGRLSLLYPMISSMEELFETKKLVREVRDELEGEGISTGAFSEGIMVETPAAVELSHRLARECDFFSIGTNDLMQYTYAADRSDPMIIPYLDTGFEAILSQIKRTVKNAHAAGIPVRICGEMAADTSFTKRLLSLDLDGFSVAPGNILPLKRAILEDQS